MTGQTSQIRPRYGLTYAVVFTVVAAMAVAGSVWATSKPPQSELPNIRIDVLEIMLSSDNSTLPDLTVKEPF